ncbi:hypothetical protein WA026_005531 [Henosepilachna vigintioctopunctata]|uniref:Uncharacterized protein n=1 Tax=Henosepilachna vigintioctopunctata TaxID=420089 RepID=A0AAW1U361_9CUCU
MDSYSNFSEYLPRKDSCLYVKLLLQYEYFACQLGHSTTKQFVSENNEAILEHPQKYLGLHIFHKNAFVSELGDDFQRFLCSTFTTKLSDMMYSAALDLLNYCPKKN